MKDFDDKYWFEVLKHFDNKRYFQNGLTIPFLIGSKTILSDDKDILTVEMFLNQIENKEIPSPVTMLKCGNLGEYVIGILDNETNRFIHQYKKNDNCLYREFGSLVIVDDSFNGVNDFKEIKKILENSYQKIVDAKSFSREMGNWTIYSESDLEKLAEIKKYTGNI
jgi:hypothetical protein